MVGKERAAANQDVSRARRQHRQFIGRVPRADGELLEAGERINLDAAAPVALGPLMEVARRRRARGKCP
jgi:hypothetical protein